MEISNVLFRLIILVATSAVCSVVERDVTYAVRTPQNPNNSNFSEAIDLSEINSSHPVILIVHGWTDTGNDPWIQNLTYAYFSQGNYNIIAVDWRKPAGHNYIASVENSRPVGNIVGDTIISICKIKNISLKQFHMIGHSLGAHVVGFAAKRVINVTGTKINWVTGLDPAGPLFEIPPQSKNNRLNNNDGNVVEIIHSDGGILGYFSPLGTIDFFPNGGRFIQPNCNDTNVNIFSGLYNQVGCSHLKSVEYYTKAVRKLGIVAYKCSSWLLYQAEVCRGNNQAKFGGLHAPKQRGNYFVALNY